MKILNFLVAQYWFSLGIFLVIRPSKKKCKYAMQTSVDYFNVRCLISNLPGRILGIFPQSLIPVYEQQKRFVKRVNLKCYNSLFKMGDDPTMSPSHSPSVLPLSLYIWTGIAYLRVYYSGRRRRRKKKVVCIKSLFKYKLFFRNLLID